VTTPTYLGLRCEACGATAAAEAAAVCDACWGPLECAYDMAAVRASLAREPIGGRPRNVWRYRELLPVSPPAELASHVGFTPLVAAPRLAARLGIAELWIKDEGACHPTLSFKDRLVAVAVARALAMKMPVVACSSTGNLAAAVAARAAACGLPAVVIVPEGVEAAKLAAVGAHGAQVVQIRGDYDRASRLSVHVADRYGWAVVNVNLRAFYTEGAKTIGYEIVEQRHGRLPGHVIVPVAGGGLFLKLGQSFHEARAAGIATAGDPPALYATQPEGCAPVVTAWRDGRDDVPPVRPRTMVHSLAVGDPADGPRALQLVRASGGRADAPSDEEAVAGVRLLAETEGLFVETAGGLVVAAAGRLARQGAFADGRAVVLVITGHGMKTVEVLPAGASIATIDGSAESFDTYWKERGATAPTRSGTAAG